MCACFFYIHILKRVFFFLSFWQEQTGSAETRGTGSHVKHSERRRAENGLEDKSWQKRLKRTRNHYFLLLWVSLQKWQKKGHSKQPFRRLKVSVQRPLLVLLVFCRGAKRPFSLFHVRQNFRGKQRRRRSPLRYVYSWAHVTLLPATSFKIYCTIIVLKYK